MHLTIVLVNWRNSDQTIRCARSIRQWQGLKPAIVIVDNETTGTSLSALEAAQVADKLIPSTTNRVYGGGNNLGLAAAVRNDEAAVMLLNTDAEISEAAVAQLLNRLEADRRLSIVGPVLVETGPNGTSHHAGGRDIAKHPRTRIPFDPERNKQPGLIPVDYVPGTVFMARASLLDDLGCLDEDYFFSGEIADFCKRAANKGYRVCIDPLSMAVHETEPGKLRDTLYVYHSLRNRFLYVRKHHASLRLPYFAFWTLVGAKGAAAAVARGRLGRARAIGLAVKHGLTGRYGNQNAAFI